MTEARSIPQIARGRRMILTDEASVAALGDPFRPLEPECKVLQFSQPLTRGELHRAGELVADRPDVQLYVYRNGATDLDFLQWFGGIRRLHVALYELKDIGGFDHVKADIEEFTFGQTRLRFSNRFLEKSPHLKSLFLVGHDKDLEAVATLPTMNSLGISGITLRDLSVFAPLEGLQQMSIFLGGTRDLRLLTQFPLLEQLFLMRITKLSDLGVLADLPNLAKLRLDWMRNVAQLPSFAGLSRLVALTLDTMKGLKDLTPVSQAPALQQLSIINMPQLAAEDFECFKGHPCLSHLSVHTGKAKVNAAVKAMFADISR